MLIFLFTLLIMIRLVFKSFVGGDPIRKLAIRERVSSKNHSTAYLWGVYGEFA